MLHSMCIEAMSDAVILQGPVPSALVFAKLPEIHILSPPELVKLASIASKGREEVSV